MKIAEVKVNGTTCDVTRLVPISKGLVGATVSIEYTDSAWDGLTKTIVFRSSVTKDVVATGSEIVIPAEVVSRAGVNLYMGVYGVDATNNVVIPTIWAELGLVHGAAAPSGDTSVDPTLPVWAQIQGMIGNLDDLDTDEKSSLVAAVNEALTKGGGEIDPADVQKIVDDYLKANPPSGGTDISLGLTSATLGQTIKVKAVDADGKPTEWEAAETGEKWEKIADVTTEEDVSVIDVALEKEYKCLYIFFKHKYVKSTSYDYFNIQVDGKSIIPGNQRITAEFYFFRGVFTLFGDGAGYELYGNSNIVSGGDNTNISLIGAGSGEGQIIHDKPSFKKSIAVIFAASVGGQFATGSKLYIWGVPV